MKKTRAPWCVLDAKEQVFRCERCKETCPTGLVIGQRIEVFLGLSDGFIKAHKWCKE